MNKLRNILVEYVLTATFAIESTNNNSSTFYHF